MRFFLLCAVCLPMFVCGQNLPSTGETFLINGTVPGLAENSVVYFAGFSENDTIARAVVKQGNFVLSGSVDHADGRMLFFTAINKRMFLFTGNEKITITASDAALNNLKVTGSPTHAEYEQFMSEIKPLGDFVNTYRQQVQMAQTEKARDSAYTMLNTAYNFYQTSIDKFIGSKKSSPVSALVLAYSYDNDPNKDVTLLEKRMQTLDTAAKQNIYAANVQRVINNSKVGAIGTKAIDFTQKDTLGKDISLSEFKGKYVLVDFWASWCGPCRRENPHVVAAYHAYKNKNFTILSVSLDQQKENWLRAIHADKLTWTHVSDLKYWGNAVAQLYHVESIPQNFLIDPEGMIIAKNLRGEDLRNKLEELLK